MINSGQPPNRSAFAALILGNIFLSFGPWFVRMADTGPVASAFWRVLIAAPILIGIAFWVKRGQPAAGGLPWALFALSGLLFAADLAAWHTGILQTKLANSNLLGNSTSLFLPLWAFIATRSLPTRLQGSALLLALLGAMLLMGRSFELSTANLVGDLLCVLAGLFYTFFLVLMAKVRTTHVPWTVTAWSTAMTPIPLLLFAMADGEQLWPTDWTPLLALALSSQILGQGLMIYVIGRVSPLVMGLSLLIQPLIGAIIGWIVYAENLSPIDWVGGAMIGLALVLVSQPDQKAA